MLLQKEKTKTVRGYYLLAYFDGTARLLYNIDRRIFMKEDFKNIILMGLGAMSLTTEKSTRNEERTFKEREKKYTKRGKSSK